MWYALFFLQADSTAFAQGSFFSQTFQVLGWTILFVSLIVLVTVYARQNESRKKRDP